MSSNQTSGAEKDGAASSIEDFLSSLDNSDSGEEDGTFYFETDYLALKGNPDYLKLIKTLAILEIQRIKTCQDMEKIESLRLRAKDDPGGVLKDILSGKVSFDTRGKIEKVPDIDWSKYQTMSLDEKTATMTRRRAKKLEEEPPPESYPETTPSTSSSGDLLVRGRKYDFNKPQTFNQLWTVEEQLRLEALLQEYPPERVEWRRWEKISNALGNRTPKQVCSRVQKYFRKLRQIGLSVPGKVRRAVSKPRLIHRKNKHLLYRPTTFFPGVAMGDMTEGSEGEGEGEELSEPDFSHWVEILDRVKVEKAKAEEPAYTPVLHYGYKCMGCGEEPIRGLRWECKTCQNQVISSCCDCLVGLVSNEEPCHPASHVFQPSSLYTNPQYSVKAFSTHNYLDPNFVA